MVKKRVRVVVCLLNLQEKIIPIKREKRDEWGERDTDIKRRREGQEETSKRSQRRASKSLPLPAPLLGWGARCNKWTVIAHNLSSKLNHFALQGALVKHFSHTNLITFSLTFLPTEMLPLTFNTDVPPINVTAGRC